MSSLYPIFLNYRKMMYNKEMVLNFLKVVILLLSTLVLFVVTVVPVTAPSFSILDLIMRIWIIANPIFALISLIKKDDKTINTISFCSNFLLYFLIFILLLYLKFI